MREKMSGLSKKTKTVILKITMIVLIAISFLVILGTTLSDNEDADIPYDSYLKEYVQKYSHDQ
jgi:predicted RND superfamily exporter protein